MMSERLSRDIVNGYRAWHAFELAQAEDAKQNGTLNERHAVPGIIDIDVAPGYKNPLEFTTREEVQEVFINFLERSDNEDVSNQDYVQQRLGASLLHSRVKGGDEVDFYEQVETALSVTPEIVEESAIDDHRQKVDDLLMKHGLRFDRAHRRKFEEMLVLKEDTPQLKARFLEVARATARLLLAQAGHDGPPVTSLVVPTIVEADEAWVGYFSTEDREPVYYLNGHPRHKYTEARITAIGFHEGAHAQDFMGRRTAIRRRDASKRIDPIAGLTTHHTPEILAAEVYALGHEQIGLRTKGARESGWRYLFQAEYHDYQEKVWNNAHIRINTGADEAAVVEYLEERLPFEDIGSVKKRLQESRDIPESRTVCAVYEPAMKIVRRILIGKVHARKDVLNEIRRRPYSEQEMRRFLPPVDELALSIA